MSARSWLRNLFSQKPTRPITRRRLVIEPLEDRTVPATFTVTNLLDDGSAGSLRWAVAKANDTAGADTITFNLPAESSRTITLTGGQLVLTDSAETTIDGGSLGVTIDGNDATRLFRVTSGATADLKRLTLQHGSSDSGGGVSNAGTLTISASTVRNNSVLVHMGSGLGPGGGGVHNSGSLTIVSSTVSGNQSRFSAGGGVHNSGTLLVIDSTFSGNATQAGVGAGLYNRGDATITSSTFIANASASLGGGVYADGGTLTIASSTITGNTAFSGGGISVQPGGEPLILTNALVIGNSADYSDPDVSDHDSNGGGNLIGLPSGYTLGQILQVDANGNPLLADNGGPTQTVALATNSPAIGTGPVAAAGATVDQRGYGRPAAGNIDIGAYQTTAVPREAASLVVSTTDDVVNAFDGLTSLRETVALTNSEPGADTITFAPDVAGGTITLTGSELVLTDAERTTIDGGSVGMTISGGFVPASTSSSSGSSSGSAKGPAGGPGGTSGLQVAVFVVENGASAELTQLTITGARHGLENRGEAVLRGATVAGHSGDGIRNMSGGELTLANVTIAGNAGVGVLNDFDATADLAFVTIAGNTTDGNGGGVNNFGTLNGANVLIVGNQADGKSGGYGGGLSNVGTATFHNLVVSGNQAGIEGGGIRTGLGGSLTLVNAVVAGNTALVDPDLAGSLSAGSAGTQVGGVIGPVVVTDSSGKPLLADNGGPTKTVALLPGSPALDVGSGTATDQRGTARPQFGAADIGAFELTVAEAGVPVITTAGVDWYLGLTPATGDRPIFYTAADGSSAPTNGFATQIGLAADGTILARNSDGDVYARTGSALDGIGTGWEFLTRRVTADGATWFLGADDGAGDRPVYRWAADGEPTWIDGGRAASLWLATDGTIVVDTSAEEMYQRVGSAEGPGTAWRLLSDSLVVTTTADEDDGTSDPSVGTGTSLREALAYANTNPGADTITFSESVFGQPTTINLARSLGFTDSARTTIQGPDARLTIEASASSGRGAMVIVQEDAEAGMIDFNITLSQEEGGSGRSRSSYNLRDFLDNEGTVEIDGLNVEGFFTAINNFGDIVVSNSMIAGSKQSAVVNFGTATVANSTFTNNAGPRGGAINNFGTATVSNSTLAGNTASGLEGGGAIYNEGSLIVTGSTLSGNWTDSVGGAIYSSGDLTLINSTLVGNVGEVESGAVRAFGTVVVESSTVAGNSTNGGYGGLDLLGAATVAIRNSLIVGNAGLSGTTDLRITSGAVTTTIVGGTSEALLVTDVNGNPLLADNGGPTQTVALVPGSPAIAAGVAVSGVTTDQRGLARNATPDLGAFETQAPTVAVTAPGGTYNGSEFGATSATVTGLNGTVLAAFGGSSPVNAEAITFEYFAGSTSLGSAAPTDAGTYVVVATFTNSVTGYRNAVSAETLFIIDMAAPAIVLETSTTRPLLGTDGLILTATVSVMDGGGTPTGSVTFTAGTTELGSATVAADGTAVLSLTAAQLAGLLPADEYTITAEYSGDANFLNSADSLAVTTLAPSTIQGMVYADLNNNGEVDFGEPGIAGVLITLQFESRTGPVTLTTSTDSNGVYTFANLRPSSGNVGYTITQTQPGGWLDGIDTLGTIGGIYVGTAGNDVFTGLTLGAGEVAENYNFGERPNVGSPVGNGDTAGIGYWQNKNGQKLIKALNGGGTAGTATQLGNWLASSFPNLFGMLAGKTNAQVAAHYKTLFARNGNSSPGGPPKLDAQVMATALAVYVTNQNLAGTTAVAYGFNVSADGTGVKTFNVGTKGAAFGVANNSSVSVMDLLLAVNARSKNGLMFDLDGNGSISSSEVGSRTMANDVFSAINELGGI